MYIIFNFLSSFQIFQYSSIIATSICKLLHINLPRWLSSKKTIHLPIQEIQETQIQSLGQEEPLEKEMATHSSILAWRIPWTEEPGGLPTVHGVAKSRTRLSDFTFTFFFLSLFCLIILRTAIM